MSYATFGDVAADLNRPISDAGEIAQVQAWLDRVEARISRRIPGLATLAADAGYLAALVGVEVDVVVRKVNNPTGKKDERVDDYSYGLNPTAAAADLWPTDEEWAELRPVRSTGAFSIAPKTTVWT